MNEEQEVSQAVETKRMQLDGNYIILQKDHDGNYSLLNMLLNASIVYYLYKPIVKVVSDFGEVASAC